MRGFNVLHPMGWDAFGLPAEQYALQTGTHPAVTTEKNIGRFREQLQSLGFSYDWAREVSTTHPKYYKWTQVRSCVLLCRQWIAPYRCETRNVRKARSACAAASFGGRAALLGINRALVPLPASLLPRCSGFSFSFSRRTWPIRQRSRSTGVLPWALCWPTRR